VTAASPAATGSGGPRVLARDPRARLWLGGIRTLRVVLFAGLGLYLVLPIIAIVLYASATRWTSSVLPDGYTLDHFVTAFSDPRLVAAFARSFALAAGAVAIDILVVVPAVYWARVRNPRIRPLLEVAAAIPFALPYLVIAFGVLTLYGSNPITARFNNTVAELFLAHAAICFPFMYWAVDGAMAAAGIERLSEAAEVCGATPWRIIRSVIAPNILPGLVSGGILVFATSFGEFAVAQVLIGGSFETVPLWQADALYSTNPRFDELAVSTVAVFILLFVLSALVVRASGGGARVRPDAAPEVAVAATILPEEGA
jgi:putative spermidine/putrescine transport system permease protein